MARPIQFPRQLVMQVSDEQAERVERDAALRGDGSKSAAARRLLSLGAILADHLAAGGTRQDDGGAWLEDAAKKVQP